jgi:hypothetical protein
MQLRMARVCLDCEEVHDAQTCPVCASESFAFLTRWVPAPERRARPRPTTSPEAETYRQLTTAGSSGSWIKRGALGLTILGLAGWAWNKRDDRKTGRAAAPTGTEP